VAIRKGISNTSDLPSHSKTLSGDLQWIQVIYVTVLHFKRRIDTKFKNRRIRYIVKVNRSQHRVQNIAEEVQEHIRKANYKHS